MMLAHLVIGLFMSVFSAKKGKHKDWKFCNVIRFGQFNTLEEINEWVDKLLDGYSVREAFAESETVLLLKAVLPKLSKPHIDISQFLPLWNCFRPSYNKAELLT